jgi:3-hydroxyisobutyrate dehydrogenase-like beta-hydroxyacid dehydrogenase
MPKLAFIGFGEAGQRFAETLRDQGVTEIIAFDIKQQTGDAKAIAEAAVSLNVTLAPDALTAVQGADWVFSAVTASSCLDAASSVAGALQSGQTYIDINSVSGGTKQKAQALMADTGARYIDMAVMAPVAGKGHATPTLVAGAADDEFIKQLKELGFEFETVGNDVGTATSIKLTRSLFVKGLEAITTQALLAAKQTGCYERVLASLSKSFAGLGWPEFAAYELERVARHGVRRGAEMRECALMMADNGFTEGAALADAIASFQHEIGTLGYAPAEDSALGEQLQTLLDMRK